MSININLKNDEDINFWEIGVSGELDVSTADEFKEYLHKLIDKEINNITSAKVKEICKERLSMIEQGKRDLRF